MLKKFRVKPGCSYSDKGGRVTGPGQELMLDDEIDWVKQQVWKLEVTGAPAQPKPKQQNIPLPATQSAEDLVDSLDFLVERTSEPPKAPTHAGKAKPGEGVGKEEAETMLSRVQKFIEEQAAKEKKGKK